MANSSYYFQTQKSLSISITLFFFLLLISNKVNSLERVSFEFTNFEQGQKNLILQGDAIITSPSPGMLELTKEQGGGEPVFFSVGRVLYETPIHIWNNHTDTIASFHTNFTFVINAVDPTKTADGLAFFLAPLDTQPHHTDGGLLGIFPNAQSIQPIVAVEFDTFFNSEWDPNGSHIGIDVGSIKSKKTTPWIMLNQVVANVSINYDAPTTSLSVSLVYPSASTSYTLKERVDLSDVLDPWVRIGFSATSGDTTDHVESHHVLSWSFHSELPDSSFSSTKGFKNTNLLDSFLLQA